MRKGRCAAAALIRRCILLTRVKVISIHIKIPTPASRVGNFHMSVCTALLFHIRELRIIRQPYEFNGSDRAVSLFGDDDFSDVFLVGVFVVVVVSFYPQLPHRA